MRMEAVGQLEKICRNINNLTLIISKIMFIAINIKIFIILCSEFYFENNDLSLISGSKINYNTFVLSILVTQCVKLLTMTFYNLKILKKMEKSDYIILIYIV